MPTEPDAVVDELAELRRRAYGPHADIGSDPVAQARLHDLEAAEREARSLLDTRAQPPAVVPGDDAGMASRSAPELHGREHSAPESETIGRPLDREGEPVDARAAPEPDAAPAGSASEGRLGLVARALQWTRAHLAWLVAAVAGIVAIAAVSSLVVGEFSRPHPELTFGIRSVPMNVAKPEITTADRDLRGMPNSALDFRGSLGKLNVWTTTGHDVSCLVFSSEGQVYWSECAHSPLLPWSEFFTEESLVPPYSLDPEIPNGSFVRFVWEGDLVKVYVVRRESDGSPSAQSPDPTQAPPVASLPLALQS